MNPSTLYVISVISNPVRYKSRVRLFKEFMERTEKSGATHIIIEATFGEREPSVADPTNPKHIIVRCDEEIWLKENLINVAVSKLPPDWKYVMWLDGDVEFVRKDWVMETLHALQHYDVVQPFSHAIDLGPNAETMKTATGFAFCHNTGQKIGDKSMYGYAHPGYCGAMTREAWETVGGMFDMGILGAGDDHMWKSLIGKPELSMPQGIHPNYVHAVNQWAERAAKLQQNIGHVSGTILHYFHGAKKNRNYWGRWDVLKDANFDPYSDIYKDSQGLWRLKGNKPGLRDGLRNYFRERHEDTIVE